MTFNNAFLSLSNFIPEIFLFSMAMVVLLIGITNPLKKYVVSLTIGSTLIALFLCFGVIQKKLFSCSTHH